MRSEIRSWEGGVSFALEGTDSTIDVIVNLLSPPLKMVLLL